LVFPASAPQAHKVVSLQHDIRSQAPPPLTPRVLEKLDAISCPLVKKRLLPAGKPYLFTSGAGSLLAGEVGLFLASAEGLP
jgi:hypothetical protein